MNFFNSLARLRDAANHLQRGRDELTCVVYRDDLKQVLHHFDRLDAEARYQYGRRISDDGKMSP